MFMCHSDLEQSYHDCYCMLVDSRRLITPPVWCVCVCVAAFVCVTCRNWLCVCFFVCLCVIVCVCVHVHALWMRMYSCAGILVLHVLTTLMCLLICTSCEICHRPLLHKLSHRLSNPTRLVWSVSSTQQSCATRLKLIMRKSSLLFELWWKGQPFVEG